MQKKACENDVNFSISEITLKKYVEVTWNFIEIWLLTYQCNIKAELTWIQRGVLVGQQLPTASK